jgi:hypothetical protein
MQLKSSRSSEKIEINCTYLLYLCGITTNTWLRPFEEDLSMTAIRAVKLLIEFVVVPPPVDTIFDFRAAYRSKNLPLKYEQLVLLSFGQHQRFNTVEQDWANQGLVNGEFCLA